MSVPKRFFIEDPGYPEHVDAVLEGEEFVHAKTVLRVGSGDEITLLDGSGKEYSAVVERVEKQRLLAHITGVTYGANEPAGKIYLLCGFLKNSDKNEAVVQKATELGACKIAFFGSRFSSAYMNDNKLKRLEKVSREAAKQCLRSRAPEVVYFPDLAGALKSAEGYKNKLFACEFIDGSKADFCGLREDCALVVGSEGGFSEEEYAYAETLGFKGVSLGKRILRAETAAITMCALAAYGLGELK